MLLFRTPFRHGLAVLAIAWTPAAFASEPSAWSKVEGAAVRLIPGSPTPAGQRRAGLEFQLDGHWKTYWRTPGDSGVPPVFNWSKSTNLAAVTVDWPAPQRFNDEGGTTIGYDVGVVLPLTVTPRDPNQAVTLDLALDYAVCDKICMPAKAALKLTLPPGEKADASFDAAIAQAQASVPVPAAIGADGPLAIRDVAFDGLSQPKSVRIEVAADKPVELIAEGPLNWYLPLPQAAAARGVYILALEGLPKGAKLSGTPLRLTLSTGNGGIETVYTLP